MEKKENPQTVRSKEWLLDALLQIMKEKSYREITIKELTKRAGLDRKTFYRHFKNKDEILEMPIKTAFNEYFTKLQCLQELTLYDAFRIYFELCIKNKATLILLNSQGLMVVVLKKFSEYVPALNDVLLAAPVYRNISSWESAYIAGGIWNITSLWVNNGAKESAEEMAKIIFSFMPSLYKE